MFAGGDLAQGFSVLLQGAAAAATQVHAWVDGVPTYASGSVCQNCTRVDLVAGYTRSKIVRYYWPTPFRNTRPGHAAGLPLCATVVARLGCSCTLRTLPRPSRPRPAPAASAPTTPASSAAGRKRPARRAAWAARARARGRATVRVRARAPAASLARARARARAWRP